MGEREKGREEIDFHWGYQRPNKFSSILRAIDTKNMNTVTHRLKCRRQTILLFFSLFLLSMYLDKSHTYEQHNDFNSFEQDGLYTHSGRMAN